MLLRLLFPSWAFFDAVTDVPVLEVRWSHAGEDWGDWHIALHAPARSWRHLLYNPEGTLHLATQSLIDRFAVECEGGVVDPVTQRLVESLAASIVAAEANGASAGRWQWRVGASASEAPPVPAPARFRVLHESAVVTGLPHTASPAHRS